jgi:hypothetical protein
MVLFSPFSPPRIGDDHLEQSCSTPNPTPRKNGPYYALRSSTFGSVYACIRRRLKDYYRKRFTGRRREIAEETASQQSSVIDVHVLESLLDAISEDGAWETVFEAFSGLCGPELVNVRKARLPDELRIKFSQALNGFLDRTFSSSSVTKSVRSDRLIICLNAAYAALCFDGVSHILWDILTGRWFEPLQSVEIGHSLRHWSNSKDERFTLDVRRIVAQIVVGARERDDRWISLVEGEYGIAENDLRGYIGHGDSELLFILIHTARQTFHTGSWTPWILSSLSDFTIRNTSPELQHAFCMLWNDIVRGAWNQEWPINIPVRILREVRHVYIALHEGTDAALTAFFASTYHFDPALDQPWSYRLCNVANHRQRLPIHALATGSVIVPSLTQLDQSPPACDPTLLL